MIKQCKVCNKDFTTYQNLLNIGKGKYCSRACSNFTTNKKVINKCKICSSQFQTSQERIKDGRGKFCSRDCYKQDWVTRIPGWNKGQSATWAIGNQHRKGIPNLNPNKMYGEDNHQWKENDFGYRALHTWKERQSGKPTKCEHCGKDNLTGRQIHWANKSREYKRDLSDWLRLCAKCHKKYDC